MTITKEPPGLWFVTCDKCGDRHELDTDPDDSIVEAVAEVKLEGWRVLPPERQQFTEMGRRLYTETYWHHWCPDCRE